MPYPVRYRCPRCDTVVSLERSGYLADQSVTAYPLEGWTYAAVGESYDAADGVRVVCGEGETDGPGCGEPYYLNFVRFEDGQRVDPDPEPELVEVAPPRGVRGPRTPGGPRW